MSRRYGIDIPEANKVTHSLFSENYSLTSTYLMTIFLGISEATETFQDIVVESPETGSSGGSHLPPTPGQVDTLYRRLSLMKKAVRTLSDGLNMRNHPGIMSEHRIMLLSQRPVESVHGQ